MRATLASAFACHGRLRGLRGCGSVVRDALPACPRRRRQGRPGQILVEVRERWIVVRVVRRIDPRGARVRAEEHVIQ
eukprot:tig00000396_g24887.t1